MTIVTSLCPPLNIILLVVILVLTRPKLLLKLLLKHRAQGFRSHLHARNNHNHTRALYLAPPMHTFANISDPVAISTGAFKVPAKQSPTPMKLNATRRKFGVRLCSSYDAEAPDVGESEPMSETTARRIDARRIYNSWLGQSGLEPDMQRTSSVCSGTSCTSSPSRSSSYCSSLG